ncbi:hypothetical protein WOC76_00345 [Methylocystis sp. IM3]|uniref:hypothetical protein n=1 Tax=unclassified Methylocystis TaxID=2625913 RepID=UPI0030F6624B
MGCVRRIETATGRWAPQARAALFGPPNDPAAIIRHYTLILLPAAKILERIGLAARARVRKQAHKNLIGGLEQRTINELQALIAVSDDRDRTQLAWLCDGPEAPTQKNLVGIVERLQFVRSPGVGRIASKGFIAPVIGRSPRKRLFSARSIFYYRDGDRDRDDYGLRRGERY